MPKMFRRDLPLFLLLAAVSAGLGCRQGSDTSSSAGGADKLLRIAVIPKGTTHEYWKAVHAGALKAEAELDGVEVIWKGPQKEDDREQQITVVENFITDRVDGIVIAPLSDKALLRPIRDARKAGIEVVVIDSGLAGEVGKDFASFVATDNYLGGVRGAQRLGELLGGKGKVMMMRYQVGSASTTKREQGFLDTMRKKFPDIEIVSGDQYAGATVELALEKSENLLTKFQDLDGIFTPNESSTFGMLRALQQSGRAGKVMFVGFDSSIPLIEALDKGELHGLVLQRPLNMCYTGVKTLVKVLRGQTVAPRIDTGSVVATKENMNTEEIKELLSPPIECYLAS